MTEKERFINTLSFKEVDRIPFMEICLWQQTTARWISEGMPETVNTAFMCRGDSYFGLEGYDTVQINATGPVPEVEGRVLEEDEDRVLFIDSWGRKRRARKDGTVGGTRLSMDTYLEFAVKDRKSWLEFKKRYEGPREERYPSDWKAVTDMARTTHRPLTLLNPLAGTFGYYSMLRNWIGTEPLSYMFYDNEPLIEECLEFLTDFIIKLLDKAAKEIKFDFYYIHEDMSFKNGPLMSPALFRKLILPHYKRFVSFLRSHGVKLILVDTDGNPDVLLPLFIEAGINGFGPVERASDMDPVELRKKYGRDLCMVGGVDKRKIALGRKAIDEEMDHLAPLINQGGFIPTIDHAVPPETSLDDFKYYLDVKRKLIFE